MFISASDVTAMSYELSSLVLCCTDINNCLSSLADPGRTVSSLQAS